MKRTAEDHNRKLKQNFETSDKNLILCKNRHYKKFSIREFSGAFGDWGTLIPFIIGYISIVGLSPAGIFLTLGITNIILGIRYNLPLPVQPQKTIGTVAIAQQWNKIQVISTGLATGIIWFILGFSKKLNKIVEKVPLVLVRGIQLGLALILGYRAITFIFEDIIWSLIAISIIILSVKYPKIPAAIILTAAGIMILFISGAIGLSELTFSLPSFEFTIPTWNDLVYGMIYAGFAQLFLTLTNVMIATVQLAKDLFPEKEDAIDANSLALNMGAMNIINPFIAGMPLCHGSGGLASQYAFGARTGGSMIFEGILELLLGLFVSDMLFLIFSNFPVAILGTMLLYTAFFLGKISFKDFKRDFLPTQIITALFSVIWNISIGFFTGLLFYIVYEKIRSMKKKQEIKKKKEKKK